MIIITDIQQLAQPSDVIQLFKQDGTSNEQAVKQVADQLITAMNENANILALAAPQIGHKVRIFGIRFNDTIKVFINPVITKKQRPVIIAQTNPSYPGKQFVLARPSGVTVVYYNQQLKYQQNKLLDKAAMLFDQQYQMLDGVLQEDIALMSDIQLDGSVSDLTDQEFSQVAQIYKQFIAAKQAALHAEITSNSDLNSVYRKLKFTEDVINGRTEIVQNRQQSTQSKMAKAQARKQQNRANTKRFLSRKAK